MESIFLKKEMKAAIGIRGKPENTNRKEIKRYNLALPQELYAELQNIAENEYTTVLEVIKKFIKIGLISVNIQNDPDSKLIIKQKDKERELSFIF